MRLQRILHAVYSTPLFITAQGHETIDAVLRPHLLRGELPQVKADDGKDFFGGALPKMEIQNGVAIIPIKGPLLQHAGMMDKMCGACSYDDIKANIGQALARGASGIVLNIDSPGGEMTGCYETAQLIAETTDVLPVYAFTDSMMASAAYHLAAGCTGIFTTASATVGSIGCIIGFLDTSKAMEAAGVKPVYITSGKYKGAGAAGTSLTDDQYAYLEGMVMEAADGFKTFVSDHRPSVAQETMQGQVFFGRAAADNGLCDAVVSGIEDVVEMCGR
jgi:signal peptide peptidase SppA